MVFLNCDSDLRVRIFGQPGGPYENGGGLVGNTSFISAQARFQCHSPEQIELPNTFADVLPESHLQLLRALEPWFIYGDFECRRELARSPNQPVRRRSARIRDNFLTADG
jgi:hypothetical protein